MSLPGGHLPASLGQMLSVDLPIQRPFPFALMGFPLKGPLVRAVRVNASRSGSSLVIGWLRF